jgi:hypothetical protein
MGTECGAAAVDSGHFRMVPPMIHHLSVVIDAADGASDDLAN